ncbi:hypothetical protein L6452_43620 [Arctium lappa]|uniref:Uncharacterized protein n=1 Tax=Arctium lappa TaxID=4217 RepID=A0ACB8XF77_ARCLA|nr:hypothetical protein L6452_43620 [Arctium lappa]
MSRSSTVSYVGYKVPKLTLKLTLFTKSTTSHAALTSENVTPRAEDDGNGRGLEEVDEDEKNVDKDEEVSKMMEQDDNNDGKWRLGFHILKFISFCGFNPMALDTNVIEKIGRAWPDSWLDIIPALNSIPVPVLQQGLNKVSWLDAQNSMVDFSVSIC